jgi:hypothetical protein
VLPVGLGAAEIDAAVRERTLRGEAIYFPRKNSGA